MTSAVQKVSLRDGRFANVYEKIIGRGWHSSSFRNKAAGKVYTKIFKLVKMKII